MDERIAVSVEELAEDIRINVVDTEDFNSRVIGAYNDGTAEKGLEADDQVARSIIPAATGALRDFSYIAPEIPESPCPSVAGSTTLPRMAVSGHSVTQSMHPTQFSVMNSGMSGAI